MSGYTLYAIAADGGFRLFATTAPVDATAAGRIAARRFRELSLPTASAVAVSSIAPGSYGLLLAGDGVVYGIALIDSERVDELRRLAGIGEGSLLVVAIEPLEIAAPPEDGEVTWCPRCLDHPLAAGERRCAACRRLALLRGH
jgi:hypothetical protein